jgi:hypothetical protein
VQAAAADERRTAPKGTMRKIQSVQFSGGSVMRWRPTQEANVKLRVLAEQIAEDVRGAGLVLNSQSEFDRLLLTAHRRIGRSNNRPVTE